MKYVWSQEDIIPGRIVCKPPSHQGNKDFIPCANSAKWTYKIGYCGGAEANEKYVLICMADGSIRKGTSKENIATELNVDGLMPMPHPWFIKQMEWQRDCYDYRME